MPQVTLAAIVTPLRRWFAARKRPLPWRDDPRPYYVWISEIMLQQTRVTAVLPYFDRFINALPDVAALAAVEDDALLKLWEGLGYYSRARNLKKAAQIIMTEHGGTLPAEAAELEKLPGIGRYTAGAISSIAFGRRVPAVDGNVLRVIARLTGDSRDVMRESTRRVIETAVGAIIPRDAAAFNQALMELGALVCLPRAAARCDECPLAAQCVARAEDRVASLPAKAPKKERRVEARTVLWVEGPAGVALHRRPSRGLLAGLWELPNVAGHLTRQEVAALAAAMGWPVKSLRRLPAAHHVFTHIEWQLIGWRVRLKAAAVNPPASAPAPLPPLTWAAPGDLKTRYGIPTAFRYYVPAEER
ncbi:MAG: A/G-specific adenine glycosylase [Schwartzia sp.]|nr:A/G-specific adenine glycosylase [Schwartzia sp. (in: firmicutes)]